MWARIIGERNGLDKSLEKKKKIEGERGGKLFVDGMDDYTMQVGASVVRKRGREKVVICDAN